MYYNEEHMHFKNYKLDIHIHITELVKCDNMIIVVNIGKNGKIKN
jgi:hypothetical protein